MAEQVEEVPVKDEEWVPDAQSEANELEENLEDLVEVIGEDEDKPLIADEDTPEEKQEREKKKQSRFQKRIDKLTAQRQDAERRADFSDARANNLEHRMGTLEENSGRQSAEGFQQRYDVVRNQLLEATEAGDTARQVGLQEQMADMRATVRVAEAQKRNFDGMGRPQQSQAETEDAPPLAYSWWDKNKWFNDTAYKAESAYAREIDAQLNDEGFDKDNSEYYEELDSRLQSKFPELYKEEGSDVKPKPKPPTAPTGGRLKGGGQPKDGRIRLTREQLGIARELGLTTKSELEEYVKEISKQENA